MSDEDKVWFDLRRDLSDKDDSSFLRIADRVLPESAMANLSDLESIRPIEFLNVTFPEGHTRQLMCSRSKFKKGVTFHGCKFRCKYLEFQTSSFEGGLSFINCTDMPEIVTLNGTGFGGLFDLRRCKFHNLHIFGGEERKAEFRKPVTIETCDFDEFIFLGAKLQANCIIKDVTIVKKLSFRGTEMERVYLMNLTVKPTPPPEPGQILNGFEFGGCPFVKGIHIEEMNCEGDFAMHESTINGPLSIQKCSLGREVVFFSVAKGTNAECYIDDVTAVSPGALEPIFRYAKVVKQERGDLDAAGDFYYQERKAHNAHARNTARWKSWPWSQDSKVQAWLGWLLGEQLLGYGEKPQQPLKFAVGAFLLFAGLYFAIGGLSRNGANIGDCLYFSAVTFTTLGYGDIVPLGILARILACMESFLGMALMSVFLVTLTRRLIR